MPEHTYVITGLPRSGTTYLAAVLHRPPRFVTVSDPWGHWIEFHRRHGVSTAIVDELAGWRARILAGESIPTFDGTPGHRGEALVDTWNQEKVARSFSVTPEFELGMKNPEIFLAHLGVFLDAGLRCVVTVRHPESVIGSWAERFRQRAQRGDPVDRELGNGRSAVFAAAGSDPTARRIELHEHLVSMLLPFARSHGVLVVRHEDWFSDAVAQLDRITGFLGFPPFGAPTPPPMRSRTAAFAPEEAAAIRRACTSVSAFGYPLDSTGALRAP